MGISITIGRQEAGQPWQVTLKTIDRRDFCRGTLPAERTEDEVRTWVMDQCKVYGLAYAVIERW
jgi:hypothetical protein